MVKVRLRKPLIGDAGEFTAAVKRSRALHRGLVTPPDNRDKFRAYLKSLKSSGQEGFLVVDEQSGDIAGVININEIVRGAFQSAYLGYYAFNPYAGRGFMREGMKQAIRHCFTSMKLHRLEANIQPVNSRSIALVQSLGFRCEGLSPAYLKVSGRWRDHQRWAILNSEWKSSKIK